MNVRKSLIAPYLSINPIFDILFLFLQQSTELTDVRDVILQSWNRSKEFKDLNPMIPGSIKNISDDKLKEIRGKNEVFHLSQPVLKHAEQQLSNSNHVLLFCDSDGIIFDCYGDRPITKHISWNDLLQLEIRPAY